MFSSARTMIFSLKYTWNTYEIIVSFSDSRALNKQNIHMRRERKPNTGSSAYIRKLSLQRSFPLPCHNRTITANTHHTTGYLH